MRETDSHSVAKHTFLPMGKVQAKDATEMMFLKRMV